SLERAFQSLRDVRQRFRPIVFRLEDRLVPGETLGASMLWAGSFGSLAAASYAASDSNVERSTGRNHAWATKEADEDDSESVSILPANLRTPADKGASSDYALASDAPDAVFAGSDQSDDLGTSLPGTAPIAISLPVMNEHAVSVNGASGGLAPHNF